jgi:Rrf2 family protein
MKGLFSKRCELGLQAVLYLSSLSKEHNANVKEISEKISTPRDFTSKVLQDLSKFGIVESRQGQRGGYYLSKPMGDIYLIDIVKAIDGMDIFNTCLLGFPGCSQNAPCPVHEKWGPVRDEILDILSSQSLAELYVLTEKKLNQIIEQGLEAKNKTNS